MEKLKQRRIDMSQGLIVPNGLGGEQAMIPRRQNIRERLEMEKTGLERRVVDINKALSLLDRNPDTEELMNLIS